MGNPMAINGDLWFEIPNIYLIKIRAINGD